MSQRILGIRPAYDRPSFAPVQPSEREGQETRALFRGATYALQARRVGPEIQACLEVAGNPVERKLVLATPSGMTAEIFASIGCPHAWLGTPPCSL